MAIFLLSIPIAIYIKLKMSIEQFNSEAFKKSYGNLIEGMKTRKNLSILVFPFFFINRLVYAFLPLFLKNQPSLQIIFLFILNASYTMFLSWLKVNKNYGIDYFQDILNEFMLVTMYSQLFFFVDGGIIHGTPNDVSMQNKVYMMAFTSFTFISIGLFVVLVNLAILCIKNSKWIFLIFKKYHNIYENNMKLKEDKK